MICDTRDFGIGRRVSADNWNALRIVGESANRRLLDAEAQDALPAPDVVTFEQVTRPSATPDGLYAPGMKFGDPRVMSLFAAILSFTYLIDGFTNRQLVERVGGLFSDAYSSRHATYDLRRLRRKGLITRIPKTRRYQLTPLGRGAAVLFTKAYSRVLTPGLSLLDPALPPSISTRHPLAVSWRRLERELDQYCDRALVAA